MATEPTAHFYTVFKLGDGSYHVTNCGVHPDTKTFRHRFMQSVQDSSILKGVACLVVRKLLK